MHSKYDNMHRNEIFYALTCINNHANTSISCILSMNTHLHKTMLEPPQVRNKHTCTMANESHIFLVHSSLQVKHLHGTRV